VQGSGRGKEVVEDAVLRVIGGLDIRHTPVAIQGEVRDMALRASDGIEHLTVRYVWSIACCCGSAARSSRTVLMPARISGVASVIVAKTSGMALTSSLFWSVALTPQSVYHSTLAISLEAIGRQKQPTIKAFYYKGIGGSIIS
jgi:hypothetical protein